MSRHATSERPKVPQEVKPVPNTMTDDDTARSTERFRADKSGTSSVQGYQQLSFLLEDNSCQGGESLDIQGTNTASAERPLLSINDWHLGQLRGVDDGAAFSLSPFPLPCNEKRKRDVENSYHAFSEADRSTLNITLARLTPVDRLESDTLLRAYSDIVFCRLFSSPSPLD